MADGTEGLQVTVLGSVGASRDGIAIHLAPAEQETLALLVAAGDKGAAKWWLADEIWPNGVGKGWQAAVRMRISRVRRALGLPPSDRKASRYVLDVDPTAVDAWHLLDLDQASPEWEPAMVPYLRSVSTFADVDPSLAILSYRHVIEAAQHSAIMKLARHPGPVPFHLLVNLARHLDEAPSNEALCAAVARIHLQAGRADDALAMIDRCQSLRAASHRSPSPQLEELRHRATAGTPAGPGVMTASLGTRAGTGPAIPPGRPAARPPNGTSMPGLRHRSNRNGSGPLTSWDGPTP